LDILDKIFTLLSEKNITAAKLSKDIGISSGLISQWKKGLQKPSLDVVLKIADYLEVSIDYLLGREESKNHEYVITMDIAEDLEITKLKTGFDSINQTAQYFLQQ